MLLLLALLVTASFAAVDDDDEIYVDDDQGFENSRLLGEQLDFVERNVLNLLRLGSFPQFFDVSYERIRDCGCYYAPTKIVFGTEVGMQCTRDFGESVKYDEDTCGIICNDPHGLDMVLFCPSGWSSDCSGGCYAPNDFEDVGQRADFWELTLTSLMLYGSHYIGVRQDYLDSCGCYGKVRPIRYGSKIGFDCLMAEDAEDEQGEGCSAASMCEDVVGRRLVTFCPAGHKPTCSGCEKALEGDTLEARLTWMIDVIKGYSRESLEMLGWEPSAKQTLACGCMGATTPIPYGNLLGFYCNVKNVEHIGEDCGPNVLCDNQEGDHVLHFCPDGWQASCTEGCSLPWEAKDEL